MSGDESWINIRDMLRTRGFRSNPAQGQNFLFSNDVFSSLCSSVSLKSGEQVAEIGTGLGTLTEYLLNADATVYSIEINEVLARYAREKLRDHRGRVEIHNSSIMAKGRHLEPYFVSRLCGMKRAGGYKLIASLPYSVSTPLFAEIMRSNIRPDAIAVVVQKDFAERICAGSNSRALSPISIFLATFGNAEIIRGISRQLFHPVPDVESVIMRWLPSDDAPHFRREPLYFEIVTSLFQMRRKKLSNVVEKLSTSLDGLSGVDARAILEAGKIDLNRRAEQLEVDDFIAIYCAIAEHTAGLQD